MTADKFIETNMPAKLLEAMSVATDDQDKPAEAIMRLVNENAKLLTIIDMAIKRPDLFKALYGIGEIVA